MAKYCTNCGTVNPDIALFCQNCGYEFRETDQIIENNNAKNIEKQTPPENLNNPINKETNYINYNKKSPGVAALLSFILVGAGFLYIENTKKFIIYFIIGIILYYLTFYSSNYFAIIEIPFMIYQIYDAYRCTKEYNTQLYLKYLNTSLEIKNIKK